MQVNYTNARAAINRISKEQLTKFFGFGLYSTNHFEDNIFTNKFFKRLTFCEKYAFIPSQY